MRKGGNGQHVEIEQFLADLKAIVRDGQELLKASVGTVKESALAGAQTTDRMMHERPWQTLAMAFGLGVLAGALLSGSLTGKSEGKKD